MRIRSLVLMSALSLAFEGAAGALPRTMRLDYFHTGNVSEERFALDRIVVEPLEWPGNPARPLDDTNSGKYFFEVVDRASGRVVYSRGFASIYGEWETTDEAKKIHRTFHESLRFPTPGGPVDVVLKKRDAKNAFRKIWTAPVDPKDMYVDTALPRSPGPVIEIQKSGPPSEKVDLLILGDGYTAAERSKFEKDARRLAQILFSKAPFGQRRADFNVWALCPPAEESGISRPSTGLHRRSPIGATYDAFGSERYVLTFDNRAFREAASFAPYDHVEILTNSKTYGGGGIFNLYSTVAADSLWSPYVFVHEFGHHFAALEDEYFTSDVAYAPAADRVEPHRTLRIAEILHVLGALVTPCIAIEGRSALLQHAMRLHDFEFGCQHPVDYVGRIADHVDVDPQHPVFILECAKQQMIAAARQYRTP